MTASILISSLAFPPLSCDSHYQSSSAIMSGASIKMNFSAKK